MKFNVGDIVTFDKEKAIACGYIEDILNMKAKVIRVNNETCYVRLMEPCGGLVYTFEKEFGFYPIKKCLVLVKLPLAEWEV